MGLDTKIDWLTDRQSQCDSDSWLWLLQFVSDKSEWASFWSQGQEIEFNGVESEEDRIMAICIKTHEA
jgi:hypothetical protein